MYKIKGLFVSKLRKSRDNYLSASPVQQQEAKQEKKDDLVGQEDQSRFAYLRQMNALKLEMKKAVHQENFERAAELRDQIRSLEAAHKEQKENK